MIAPGPGMPQEPDAPMLSGPRQRRRRDRMIREEAELTLGPFTPAGVTTAQSGERVIPIRDCPISHPSLSTLLATLNDWYAAGVYPDLRGKAWIEVKVVGSPDMPLLQLVIGGIGGMDLPNRPELHPLADKLAALSD